jgi:hypothetical protein
MTHTYEELGAVMEHEWFVASNAAVEPARQRHGLVSPDR